MSIPIYTFGVGLKGSASVTEVVPQDLQLDFSDNTGILDIIVSSDNSEITLEISENQADVSLELVDNGDILIESLADNQNIEVTLGCN